MEEGKSAFKIFTRKPAVKRPLEKPRRRWQDNIRMDLKEIGVYEKLDYSAQDRDYWRNLRVSLAIELVNTLD